MGEGSTKRRHGGAGLLLTRDNIYSAKDTTPAGRGRGQGISKNHAIVCIEDLRVSNMTSSAAGSIPSPGSKVGARSVLNRSILDQGWAELRRQLEYKLAWNGGRLIAVPAINTSRACPECGCTGQGNRKTQARFCCVACGLKANADLVAAINVRRAGLARIACEVNDGVSGQQQEPISVAA